MLYHVPDRPKALAEIRRVLKPGGCFYASTLSEHYLHELGELFPVYQGRFGHSLSFTLENGRDQLAAHFTHIEEYRYESTLVITEAKPLVLYLRSMSRSPSALTEEQWATITKQIQDVIAEYGAVTLTNNPGLFEAW